MRLSALNLGISRPGRGIAPIVPGVAPDALPNLGGWHNGDGSGASHFILNAGNVEEWVDQSGNNLNLQQFNSNFWALRAAGLDGKTALDLNSLGGNEYYRIASGQAGAPAFFNNPAGLTVVSVMREQIAVPAANQFQFFVWYDGITSHNFGLFLNRALVPDQWASRSRNASWLAVDIAHPAAYDLNWHMFVYRWDKASGVVSIDIDGVKASNIGANANPGTFTQYRLGATSTPSQFSRGLFQEHFFYNEAKSDADVANLRLWLQNKYPSLP